MCERSTRVIDIRNSGVVRMSGASVRQSLADSPPVKLHLGVGGGRRTDVGLDLIELLRCKPDEEPELAGLDQNAIDVAVHQIERLVDEQQDGMPLVLGQGSRAGTRRAWRARSCSGRTATRPRQARRC